MPAAPLLPGRPVSLAPFEPADVTASYIRWLNDPVIMRFTEARFQTHTRESALAYVAGSNRSDVARLWRILTDGGRHIGNIRLSGIDAFHRRAAIAIIIGEAASHGRGLGTAAIALVAEYAFTGLGLNKLTAGIYTPNVACVRAFEKAGFTREAVLRRHHRLDDGFVDTILMARFRTEGAG